MVTVSLILVAIVVLALLVFAAYLMAECGFTALWFIVAGVPQGLCHVLGLIVLALFENAND